MAQYSLKVLPVIFVLTMVFPNSSYSQTFPLFKPDNSVAVIDRSALYSNSEAGKRLRKTFDAKAKALAEENRRIDKELGVEERNLTEDRKTLTPEEFNILAKNFDVKVKEIRQAQALKLKTLNEEITTTQAEFLAKATPILLELIEEMNIDVVLSSETVLLVAEGKDITELAIQRINQELN